jgi:hypothetical protein
LQYTTIIHFDSSGETFEIELFLFKRLPTLAWLLQTGKQCSHVTRKLEI